MIWWKKKASLHIMGSLIFLQATILPGQYFFTNKNSKKYN